MSKTPLAAFIVAILLSPCGLNDLTAGEFNPDISVGDAAPKWKDLPGTDGKKHSLDDLKDSKAVVVVFTCNSCPYAIDAEDRLVKLAAYCQKKKVAVVAINVNKVPDDLMPAMKEKAAEKKFTFAYLFDETQQIAKGFGARYTPEWFVLDGKRKIAYMGSLDDSPDGKAASKHYVRGAVDAVLSGDKLAVSETVPIGCRIRFERKRRSRSK